MGYKFREISECNMCGAGKEQHKFLGTRLKGHQGYFPSSRQSEGTLVFRCLNCRLIFCNPIPIPEQLKDHYGISPEQYWGTGDLTYDGNHFVEQLRKLRDFMHVSSETKALDIGAGIGHTMVAMQHANIDAYGLEPSMSFYKYAIQENNISTERIKADTIEDAVYGASYFDFINYRSVLEHFVDPYMALKKGLSWLKKDGVMHVEVPSSDWLISALGNLFYKVSAKGKVVNLSPMHPPYHLYEFSLRSFEELSDRLDYDIVDTEYYVCDTYLPRFLDPILKPWMRRSNRGMMLALWLRKKPQ